MRILPRMRGRDLYGGILLPAERKGVLQRLRPRGEGDRRGTGDAAASGGNEIEEGRPPAARFLCDPISFSLPEKETVSPAKGKEGKVRTAVLNLAQNILVFSCPPCQTLPPERALRSAHRLSAELPSKTNACGPMSTREGQAASVTLLRREQLRSASAPTGCGAKSGERADRVVRPYRVRRKIGGAGGQSRPPLRLRRGFFEKWARGDTGRHRGLLQGTRRSARMVASKKKKSPAGGQPAGLFSWKGGNRFGRRKVGQQRFCGNDARTAT